MTDHTARLRAALGDRYRIERELGRGGMATVFLAHDLRHDRPVALKTLHPELAQSLGADRFLQEIKLAARLQHPHILSVHDSGEAAGLLWFTMPYVEGESLRDRLRREHQLPLDDALRITHEAARALDYAHRHGVVHRDVKPENILLTKDGDTLVADFGIGRAIGAARPEERLTETGIVVGTPAYMSPEQGAGERDLDGRTDVYSLAVVLYEMLAGEPPFTGATAQAITARRLTEAPRPLRPVRESVPQELEQLVMRAGPRSGGPARHRGCLCRGPGCDAALQRGGPDHGLGPGGSRSEPTRSAEEVARRVDRGSHRGGASCYPPPIAHRRPFRAGRVSSRGSSVRCARSAAPALARRTGGSPVAQSRWSRSAANRLAHRGRPTLARSSRSGVSG